MTRYYALILLLLCSPSALTMDEQDLQREEQTGQECFEISLQKLNYAVINYFRFYFKGPQQKAELAKIVEFWLLDCRGRVAALQDIDLQTQHLIEVFEQTEKNYWRMKSKDSF